MILNVFYKVLVAMLKGIGQKFYCTDYYNHNVNKYGVKCLRSSLRYLEKKGWINEMKMKWLVSVVF